MKKSFKGFIMGLIAGLVISCVCVGAVNSVVTKELHYNDIKVTLNGQEITPKDANGNVVEPFIIDGTTYLPVRAVANALGLDVNWDGETNTVKLGKDSSDASDTKDIPSGTGSVAYDKDGIRITYKEMIEYPPQKAYCLLIENNSGESMSVLADDIYADGFAMGINANFNRLTIEPGKKAIGTIYIRDYALSECGITIPETIEFTMLFFSEVTKSTKDEKIIFKP